MFSRRLRTYLPRLHRLNVSFGYLSSYTPFESCTDKYLLVLAKNVVAVEPAIGKAVFADFLTEALKSGQFQPLPKADVVGKGLKFIQEGLDKNKKGVSASKVVISLL